MKHIKTWSERCEEHPDHQERIITERMIQARMQEEIDELRQALERLDTSKGKAMSTSFKSEWLQPGAVITVDIPTLAAFAEELRRVNQENQALRQALEADGGNCYGDGTVYRGQRSKDSAVKTYTVKTIEAKLKEKNT